jgi:hypothetical protein
MGKRASSFLLMSLLGGSVGCNNGSVSTGIAPTSSGAPTSGYAGSWSGPILSGGSVSFSVSSDQVVTAITINSSSAGCARTVTFGNLTVPIFHGPVAVPSETGDAFEYEVAGPDEDPATIIGGGFLTNGTAVGTVGFTDYPNCNNALLVWSASR